jgi:hypothetical protein
LEVPYTDSERLIHRTLERYSELRSKSAATAGEQFEIGFFADKRKWYRIEYGDNRTGWIYAGDVEVARYRENSSFVALFSPALAEAQDSGHTSDAAGASHQMSR